MMTDVLRSREIRSLIRDNAPLELSIESLAVPEPGPDEIIVRVEAAPINFCKRYSLASIHFGVLPAGGASSAKDALPAGERRVRNTW